MRLEERLRKARAERDRLRARIEEIAGDDLAWRENRRLAEMVESHRATIEQMRERIDELKAERESMEVLMRAALMAHVPPMYRGPGRAWDADQAVVTASEAARICAEVAGGGRTIGEAAAALTSGDDTP